VKFLAIWRLSGERGQLREPSDDKTIFFLPRSSRVKIYCKGVADSARARASVKTFEKLISPICFLRSRPWHPHCIFGTTRGDSS